MIIRNKKSHVNDFYTSSLHIYAAFICIYLYDLLQFKNILTEIKNKYL